MGAYHADDIMIASQFNHRMQYISIRQIKALLMALSQPFSG